MQRVNSSITIVSGLPRSGTSLLMQMLARAGVPLQHDGVRSADLSNPRGYFEWERIKQLPKNPALIAECEGKAVKVISSLLLSLPANYAYRILFVERRLEHVQASQAKMIEGLGTRGSGLPAAQLVRVLEMHRNYLYAWLTTREDLPVMKIDYDALITQPEAEALRVSRFLELPDEVAPMMASVVEPQLRHHTS